MIMGIIGSIFNFVLRIVLAFTLPTGKPVGLTGSL